MLVATRLDSYACFVLDSYLKPSNYELVRDTQAIVLAEATALDRLAVLPDGSDPFRYTFRVLQVIKGDFVGLLQVTAPNDSYLGKSSVDDFLKARPGAYAGQCSGAQDYEVGKKFVLFLNKKGTAWILSDFAFSRVNEEVDDVLSPWVRAVKYYSEISSLKSYEAENGALKKLQSDARNASDGLTFPKALVADIDDHFRTPSPSKSYAELMELYIALSRTERSQVLWALAQGKHQEASVFMQNMLRSEEFNDYVGPVTEYFVQMKDYSVVPILAGYYLSRDKEARRLISMALVQLARREDTSLMLAALKSADTPEAKTLSVWFVQYPNDEATAVIKGLVGRGYLARPELSFSLAGLGDRDTIQWARRIIGTNNRDRWVGYYAISHSPLEDADRLARAAIAAKNPEDLVSLIEGYRDSQNPNRLDRLRDIVNIRERTPEIDRALIRTLGAISRAGNQEAKSLLESLQASQPH